MADDNEDEDDGSKPAGRYDYVGHPAGSPHDPIVKFNKARDRHAVWIEPRDKYDRMGQDRSAGVYDTSAMGVATPQMNHDAVVANYPKNAYSRGGAVTARGAQTLAKLRARHGKDV